MCATVVCALITVAHVHAPVVIFLLHFGPPVLEPHFDLFLTHSYLSRQLHPIFVTDVFFSGKEIFKSLQLFGCVGRAPTGVGVR